jgi:hypothetical protein
LLDFAPKLNAAISAIDTVAMNANILDDLYPFINATARFKTKTKREDSFSFLFRNLRENGRSSLDIGGFIDIQVDSASLTKCYPSLTQV